MAMLEIKDLELNYGVIKALKGINIEVEEGEIVTLIGANGAGKSSTLKAISGLEKIAAGHILFCGEDIGKVSAQNIVKAGISQVPEGRRIFAGMSVLENLEMGAYLRNDSQGIKDSLELVYKHFPILKDRSKQNAATLSGGEQQMLAMGRALMSKPKLLLLDEPSMGLAPILVKAIFSIIQDIKQQGTTVLLVEQNARMALSIADRAYVMENGKIVLSGNGKELMNSEAIQKAYLGG